MNNIYAIEKRLEEIKRNHDKMYSPPIPPATKKKWGFYKLVLWKSERSHSCCVSCC
ncbi:hypothetical protein [Halobacillus karajensis]|uniref:hypothetical protein n=1 Tax=Halobacillus karajensis TaxID=195088 RepID=UPI0012DD4E79|nr:hypothetical protein [Halobacillus karajensis]